MPSCHGRGLEQAGTRSTNGRPPLACREPPLSGRGFSGARDVRRSFGCREAISGGTGRRSEGGGTGRMCVACPATRGQTAGVMEIDKVEETPVLPGREAGLSCRWELGVCSRTAQPGAVSQKVGAGLRKLGGRAEGPPGRGSRSAPQTPAAATSPPPLGPTRTHDGAAETLVGKVLPARCSPPLGLIREPPATQVLAAQLQARPQGMEWPQPVTPHCVFRA